MIRCAAATLTIALMFGPGLGHAEILALQEGDHMCIVGGGVADAMQHSGWLETLLHARFPAHRLVIRNLGYDGDEIDPAKRLRSADFGTPDQWLAGAAPIPKPGDPLDRPHPFL
jgi:hypothetical protein